MSFNRALLLVLVTAAAASAQGVPDDPDERLSLLTRSVEDYVLTLDGPPERTLDRYPKPILRFDNPVGGVVDGVVMLWTDSGRPAALGQVFVITDNIWIHEFQSTSTSTFVLSRPGLPSPWQPRKAGVEFKPLPEAPPPAATRAGRLTQMKTLARRFQASEDFRVRSSDADTTKYELRLSPSPAYRYLEETPVTDGALFAFVHGTDPEVVLLLEADDKAWRYALAPVTCWAVQVACDGEQVWSLPEQVKGRTPEGPYYLWTFQPGAEANEK